MRSLRGDVLGRLVEAAGSIDQDFLAMGAEQTQAEMGVLLDKMESYLVSEDPQLYRSFASTQLAMRIGQGGSAEGLVHLVVTVCDVISQTARERMSTDPGCKGFILEVQRMSFVATRMLVALIADELADRQEQMRVAQGAQSG